MNFVLIQLDSALSIKTHSKPSPYHPEERFLLVAGDSFSNALRSILSDFLGTAMVQYPRFLEFHK